MPSMSSWWKETSVRATGLGSSGRVEGRKSGNWKRRPRKYPSEFPATVRVQTWRFFASSVPGPRCRSTFTDYGRKTLLSKVIDSLFYCTVIRHHSAFQPNGCTFQRGTNFMAVQFCRKFHFYSSNVFAPTMKTMSLPGSCIWTGKVFAKPVLNFELFSSLWPMCIRT